MMTLKRVILLSSVILLLGCKVKRVHKEELKVKEVTKTTSKATIDSLVSNKEFKEDIQTVKEKDLKKEDNSNIEIKGIVDKDNPLSYYNIKDGDTLSSIKIVGNAEVIYKNNSTFFDRFKERDSISVKSTQTEASVISNSVTDEIVDRVTEVQNKTVDVVKRDFQVGTYITFFLFGLAIIIGCIFLVWFKKPEIFNKIFKK